jgi:acyl-CoA dehydrogenase
VSDPFLEEAHEQLADRVRHFAEKHLRTAAPDDVRPQERTREIAGLLADAGLLQSAVPPPQGTMDLRSLVVVRENLAYYSSLADTAFAMQGLGSYPVSLAGTDVQKTRWLSAVIRGEVLCGFALTEPEAGSDMGSIRTEAKRDGALFRLTGVKTFISNAGIAGLYTVLARTSESEGFRGLSMFLVDGGAPGISVKPLEAMAPHPLGELRFDGTPALLLGEEGRGYKIALSTLDVFRPSVGAAACGLASRAMDEAVRWVLARRQFGRSLAEFQATQLALADMYVELEGARLLVRRAAWTKDKGQERVSLEGSTAKVAATEMAQRVVDRALQLHGAHGVMRGTTVERLYREVRSLRIYEGTSEIQKLLIARQILKEKR